MAENKATKRQKESQDFFPSYFSLDSDWKTGINACHPGPAISYSGLPDKLKNISSQFIFYPARFKNSFSSMNLNFKSQTNCYGKFYFRQT